MSAKRSWSSTSSLSRSSKVGPLSRWRGWRKRWNPGGRQGSICLKYPFGSSESSQSTMPTELHQGEVISGRRRNSSSRLDTNSGGARTPSNRMSSSWNRSKVPFTLLFFSLLKDYEVNMSSTHSLYLWITEDIQKKLAELSRGLVL